jgi:hypothetical protein
MATDIRAAQRKASMPEARAKAVATRKRRMAEKEAGLLAHAKITKAKPGKTMSVPLDMIPDKPYRKKTKPWELKKLRQQESATASRAEVVLALLKYLNGE